MITHVAMNKFHTVANLAPKPGPVASAITAGRTDKGQDALPAPYAEAPPVDAHALEQVVNELTRGLQNLQRTLEFSIDKSSGRTVVIVIDKETQKIIRQIPQKDVLALASRIEKAAGLLVHDEA